MRKLKKSYSWTISIVFVALFIGCLFPKLGYGQQILVKISETIDTSLIKAGLDVNIKLLNEPKNNAIRMEWGALNPVPQITFNQGKEKWQLLNYKFIAADITNPGNEDILVECRPQEMGWAGGGQIIPAGKTRTVRAYILRAEGEYPSYMDKYFYGMDALPGGIVKSYWWSNVKVDSIDKLSIVLIAPPKNSFILISNIRAEGSLNLPTENEVANGDYFPILDEFGQLRHKEWKEKVHSLEELKKSRVTEKEDIEANIGPSDWDKYGGWLKGPQLKATGSFRTEKVNGKWWLVDPDGRLFWSHGINSVSMDNSTPITGREQYFTNLPDTLQFKDFYSTTPASRRIPKGYYKGKGMRLKLFKSYAWNLYRKYGTDYENEYRKLAHKRLRSWGMNSIGNFSDPAITGMNLTPYPGSLSTGGALRIEGSEGAWIKFPDPFDKSFSEALTKSMKRNEKSVSDPYCLGFFADNELGWGKDSYLAEAVIQSPANQPAKIAMLKFLKEKYREVSKLNLSWKTSYSNWDDFLRQKQLPKSISEDTKIFTSILANEYFKKVKETMSKSAPNKLYLGCRFDFHYYPDEDTSVDWIVKIAAKYCDVVSFNRYRYSAADLRPSDADKPVMIGEFHMGCNDPGTDMLSFGLRYAENQENRAEMYKYYIKSCLENPYIVGAHWFEYYDEPILGRTDGEDLNTGFLDNCDIPYPEMINASRVMGKSMYEIRSSQ